VTLRQCIVEEIRERGPIPFSRYMELCLYQPEYGYYARNAEQFGKAGDFFTSSDVHAVFGRLLARQFEEMWRALDSPPRIQIVELGPGRGLFALDVLAWAAKKFPEFYQAVHYSLVEGSPALREKLQQTLAPHLQSQKASIYEPKETLPRSLHDPAIIFANEFFDALPVDVLSTNGELCIAEEEGRLIERWSLPSAEALEFLDRFSVHPEAGERIEVALSAQQAIRAWADALQRGFMLVIDYGYTRQEQLAGRHRGSVRAFRRHSVSLNPYEAPGEQDITADVNFTALQAAAENAGMNSQKLLTQSQFLMGIGEANQFADSFEDCQLPQERAKVALQLKHLVTPAGMGESFQVMLLSKGVPRQRTASLSGLNFGNPGSR
jgi:SAM-dependent MidA family methyltransferase